MWGDRNIPDGEVFSCPVKDSIEGAIQSTRPPLAGTLDSVRLVFRQGKVVEASGATPGG
jgi:aminopeptidase